MARAMAYEKDGRLRVCGQRLAAVPDDFSIPEGRGYTRVCYGKPGHSGLHGHKGDCAEWLAGGIEYEQFQKGDHPQLSR